MGASQQLTALAVDDNEDAIDGSHFTWSSSNPKIATVDETGNVTALAVGQATITAVSGELQGSVNITVVLNEPNDDVPLPSYVTQGTRSGRNVGAPTASNRSYTFHKTSLRKGLAPKSIPPSFLTPVDPPSGTRISPSYETGVPANAPISTATNGEAIFQGSSNYDKVFPLVNLSQRGSPLSLNLFYNSQQWMYFYNDDTSEDSYYYNLDSGAPGPGFNMYFGYVKMLTENGVTNYILGTADGTRHFVSCTQGCQTVDGTFIRIEVYGSFNYRAYFPDGTVVTYDVGGYQGKLASRVQDANGNYYTISYGGPGVGAIDTITDNLGRTIQFFYSGYNLSYITAPDLSGGRRTIVKFSYSTMSFSSYMASTYVVFYNSYMGTYTVPNRIYYPQTGTGTVFTYNDYGIISHLSQRVSMTDSSNGTEVAYTDYNYPNAGSLPLFGIPRFTQRQEWWNNADVTVPVTYSYSSDTITDPNGTVTGQFRNYGGTYDGLASVTEIQYPSGTVLQRISYTWETDATWGIPRLQSVSYADVAAGLTRTVNYSYPSSGDTFNNPTEIQETDYSNTVVRKTALTYKTSSSYVTLSSGLPRLLHLVTSKIVYDGSNNQLARTDYDYDTTSLTDRTESGGAVTGHDRTHFPTSFTYRGNQTLVKQYIDATNYIPHQTSYDILGNVTTEQLSCCQSKTLTYSSGDHYCWPSSVQSGSGPSVTEDYAYDFGASLMTSYTRHDSPSNHTTSYSYTSGTLRLDQITFPTGAYQANSYDDVNLTVTKTAYNSSAAQVGQEKSFFNGIGQTKSVKQWVGSTSYDETDMQYDSIGRLSERTNPYRVGSESQRWTTYAYDHLGRITTVTLPDSQTIQTDYNGQYMRATDPVGRQKISQVDALGRLSNVIEVAAATSDYPGYSSLTTPWGTFSGYSTSYSYDVLNNVTQISQGSQTRLFAYDGLSRLLYDKQAEQTGTISYNSQYYANKYEWDSDNPGNLRRKTDSRGAVVSYAYDGLNRIIGQHYSGSPTASDFLYYWDGSTSVSFSGDSFYSSFSQSISSSLPSGFSTNNAVGQLTAVVNSGNTAGDFYQYGTNGGVTSYVERVSSNDFAINTSYDSLLHPTSVQYPSGLTVSYGYDAAQRLTSVSSSGTNYVSSVGFNGAGLVTGLQMGDGTTESFSYDMNRLQMSNQQVTKGGVTLLNLSYTYNATSSGKFGSGTTTGNPGQLITMTDSTSGGAGKTVNYTYDLLGRLKTATTASDWNLTESYDRYGNRTSQSDTSSFSLSRSDSFDSSTNRLTTSGFSYDNSGNQTASPNYTYTYDGENRLTQISETSPSATTNYTYNVARTRVKGVGPSGTSYYISNPGGREISEKQPDGTWRDFVYFGSRLVAEITSSGTNYHHSDLQSTRVVTNSSGTVQTQQQTAPFGETVIDTGGTTAFKFSSYKRDIPGIGSDYAVNREQSPTLGRFTQPDPSGKGAMTLASPQSLNLYSYTANDPVNLSDPGGLLISGALDIILYAISFAAEIEVRPPADDLDIDLFTGFANTFDPDALIDARTWVKQKANKAKAKVNAQQDPKKKKDKCLQFFADLFGTQDLSQVADMISNYLDNNITSGDEDDQNKPFDNPLLIATTAGKLPGKATTTFNTGSVLFAKSPPDSNQMSAQMGVSTLNILGLRGLGVLHEVAHAFDKSGKYNDNTGDKQVDTNRSQKLNNDLIAACF